MKPSIVAMLQGLYWLITGIWPFLHLQNFLFVTGAKYDIRLFEEVVFRQL